MPKKKIEVVGETWENSVGRWHTRLCECRAGPDDRAGDKAGIPVRHQGPSFSIGEEVEIKGGLFKVRGFEGGLLHLQGIPKA